MKRIHHLFLILLCLPFTGFAQQKWYPGYIIDNAGHVTQGYIELRDSRGNSEQCNFKTDPEAEVTKYQPEDLSSYRFTNGKFFISRNMADQGVYKTVFLEFLVEGKLNVYHFRDANSHYYVEKEGEWHELMNTTVVEEKDDKSYEMDKKEYIGLLSALLVDANLQLDISKTLLEGKSLIKLAKTYHEEVCPDEQCMVYEMAVAPVRISVCPFIGTTFNRVKVGENLISNYNFGETAGVSFELHNFITFMENLSLKLDLAVEHYSRYTLDVNSGARVDFYYDNVYYTIWNDNAYWAVNEMEVNLNTIAVKIPISINYSFAKKRFRPYFGIGMSNMIIVSQTDFGYFSDVVLITQAIPGYNFGLLGRLGTEYKLNDRHSLNFELKYENNLDLHVNLNLLYDPHTIRLTCGYVF